MLSRSPSQANYHSDIADATQAIFIISSLAANAEYLSLPPTRHDLTQGQKPEGRLKWG